MKSVIEYGKHAKKFNGWTLATNVQQELERLLPSSRAGGRGGKSRGLHRVGAGKSSASTTPDTYTSSAIPSTTKRTIAEI